MFFLAPALGEVSFPAAITHRLAALAQQHQHVAFQPAIAAVAMAPARLQIARGALVRPQRMHREIESRQILGVNVLRGVRPDHFRWRVAERGAHGVAAESEFAVAVVLPDPVLRSGDDVAQLLFERDTGPGGCGIVDARRTAGTSRAMLVLST